jgi:hypothetical protein
MDEDGNLDYIHEDDYTDEMWSELNKTGKARIQTPTHRM